MADKTDRPIFSNVPSGSGTAGPWQTIGVAADATGSGVSARVYSRAQNPPGKLIADAAALAATAPDFVGQVAVQLDPLCIHLGTGTSAGNWLEYNSGSDAAVWGSITGTLADQTDLQAALDALQAEIDALDAETAAAALTAAWGGITGTLSGQTDLQAALDALTAAIAGKASTSHEHAAGDVTSGTFASARIPVAGTGAIGGVMRNPGAAGEFISGFGADGMAVYGVPTGAASGSVSSVAVSGTDGIEVDSGSPVTSTGTIQLGLNAAALRTHINVENGATADQSAAEILTALQTVDGPASGLDADLLDGNHASAFALAAHNQDANTITTGILATARLPVATTTAIGGVMRNEGVGFMTGFDAAGTIQRGIPEVGGGTVTVIENFTDLETLVDDAIADPDSLYKGLVISATPMEDNLSDFNSAGNKSVPHNVILEFARDGYLDFGRNVWQITDAEVTNSGGNMLFTVTGHGMSTGDVVFYRSNAPLPRFSSDYSDRVIRDIGYGVQVNDVDSFFIYDLDEAATPATATRMTYGGKNAVDIWIFRGFSGVVASNATSDVDDIADTITVPNHGLMNGMRVRFKFNGTWAGGATEGALVHYFVRGATTNTFQIATTPAGGAVNFTGSPSRAVMFVAAFEINMHGRIISDVPCFQNFVTGDEARTTSQTPGRPSVFGSFLGLSRKAIWWGALTELILDPARLTNGFGYDGSANVRLADRTEAVQAAVKARYYTFASNVYSVEVWQSVRLEFDTGVIRITDRIRIYRDASSTLIGAGSRSTWIMVDTYEGNASGSAAHTDGSGGPDYCGFQCEGGASYSFRMQGFGFIGTTRLPPSHALLHLSGMGGSDDTVFRDIYFRQYARYAIFIGPSNCNHPIFFGCSIQGAFHPWKTPVQISASGGGTRLEWHGGTLNDGDAVCDIWATFDCRTETELTITNLHTEHTEHFIYFDTNTSGRLDIVECDLTTGAAVDFLAVPVGSGNEVDLYRTRRARGTNGATAVPYRQLTNPVFASGSVTFDIASGHQLLANDNVLVWGTDGLVDGSAARISGLRRLSAVTATTVTFPLSGTGSGSLSGTAWMAYGGLGAGMMPRQGMMTLFQAGGPGEDLTFSGMALDTAYYLSRGSVQGFTWRHMENNGGILEIDFGAAHGWADGTPVYWTPPLAFTLTSVYMPTGISYTVGAYFVDSVSSNVIRLCQSRDLSDPLAFPTDFNRVTTNGTTGGANDLLGDESYYYLTELRYNLTATRHDAEDGSPFISIAQQEARLLTMVRNVFANANGEHLLTMDGVRLHCSGTRAALEGAIRSPGVLIDNDSVEIVPEMWASPDQTLYLAAGKAQLKGSATDSRDLMILET